MNPLSILYVARHNNGGNDDEGAIAHALSALGHRVTRLTELRAYKAHTFRGIDVVLFHKWADFETLEKFAGRAVRVCWYFDMVNDWALEISSDAPPDAHRADTRVLHRSSQRLQWLHELLHSGAVDFLFMTDGESVEYARECGRGATRTEWLPQGFDERCLPRPGRPDEALVPVPDGRIALYGGRNGGWGRETFIDWCSQQWPRRFRHYPRGVHGPALGRSIREASIVLAPDYPLAPRYWSNRIYLMLGNGALLCHPYSPGLSLAAIPDLPDDPNGWKYCRNDGLIDGTSLRFYHSREHLADIIEDWNRMPPEEFFGMRLEMQQRAIDAIRGHHLYRHRLQLLLHRVQLAMGAK